MKLLKIVVRLAQLAIKCKVFPGVMARIIKALSKENVNVLQTSDSHNTIWCLIKEDDTKKALSALHKEFKLYE